MNVLKIALILAISMFFGKSSFFQNKIYKEQISTKNLVNDNSTEEV